MWCYDNVSTSMSPNQWKDLLRSLKILRNSQLPFFSRKSAWFPAWLGNFSKFCDVKIVSEPRQVQINGKFKENPRRSQEIPSFLLFSRILANFLLVQENFLNFYDPEIASATQYVQINENFKWNLWKSKEIPSFPFFPGK